MDNPHQVDRPDLIAVLERRATQACESRKAYITPIFAVSSTEGVLLDFTLYILAPEIKYEYRVLNAEVVDVSNLKLTFFTLKTKQAEHWNVDISKGLEQYESLLNTILTNGLFSASLDFLVNQVLLKQEHRSSPVKDKIILGQARVAMLITGEEISVGFKEIEGDEVIYYTGQGLREIWRPSTPQEVARAEQLKQMSDDDLIKAGYMARRNISEFKNIL